MNIVPHMNQGSPEWKAWRSGAFVCGRRRGGGLGGSDIAGVLGVSPYTDPPHTRDTVFAEKVRGVEREANFAMHRGTRLEPTARLAYETRARCSAPPACVEMDGAPWARVSLDGLCRPSATAALLDRLAALPEAARERALRNPAAPPAAGGEDRWLLELKCPNWETHGAALAGVVAEHFEVQCQWQLLVTGLDRLDFASFNPAERFTPRSFPLYGEWEERYARWMELKHPRPEKRPELLDPWLELHPSRRPPMPEDWLAVVPLAADAGRQAEIMEAAASFWFEVLEAHEALAAKEAATSRPDVEAEFA